MPETKFFCDQCGQKIVCDASAAGTRFACPACQKSLTVPAPEADPNAIPVEPRDIFLSYRREGGEHLARLVMKGLVQRGYSVFMDTESLKRGKFDLAILKNIELATDVVVICSRGALDRSANEDDWVRQEIRHAFLSGKNVVPFLDQNFQMPTSLPADIAELGDTPALSRTSGILDATIERLANDFLKSEPDPAKRQIDERSDEGQRLAWARLRAMVAIGIAGIVLLMALVTVPAAWNKAFNTRFHRLGRISKETVSVALVCNAVILAGGWLSFTGNRLGPWLVLGGSVAMALTNIVLCYYFFKAVKPLHDFNNHASYTVDYFRWSVNIVPFIVLAFLYRKGK